MDWFEFLLFGLATWRISSLLVHEDGPWKAFRRLREWAGIQHDEAGEILMIPDGFFAGVLSCVWCCSMWAAAGWVGLWMVVPGAAEVAATVLALSAAAIGMERAVRG